MNRKISSYQQRRMKINQTQRGLYNSPKKSKGNGYNGYNSYKHSCLNQNNTDLNLLDLKGNITDNELELVIEDNINKTIKNKNFPLKVITHSVVDKIISFNKVLRRYDELKTIVLDPCNPYTFLVVPR